MRAAIVAVATAGIAGPATAAPFTTLQRTIQDCDGDNRLEVAAGEDHVAPGSGDDSGACQPRAGQRPRFANPQSILNFIQLSDFQTVDEESPGRVEFLDTTQRGPLNPFSAAYRPQESLTTQVVEAMVRQVRGAVSPVTGERARLTILTGDNADSQQFNETRWFIDILDGTTGAGNPDPEMNARRDIDPNSGVPVPDCEATPGSIYDGVRGGGDNSAPDNGYYNPDGSTDDGDGYSPDPADNERDTGRNVAVRDFPGLFERANRPFEAIGLGMPWYSAFGNHDGLVQGNSPDAYFGPGGALNPNPPTHETVNPVFHALVTGCVKPTSPDAQAVVDSFVAQAEALQSAPLPPSQAQVDQLVTAFRQALDQQVAAGGAAIVPPDQRRCHLAKDAHYATAPGPCETGSWIQQHFRTTGAPAGHGFGLRPPQARDNHDGYYSFSPRPGLRFAVLDSITDECGSEVCSEGSIDDAQFQWLRRELESAATQGEYVLVFSHHTLRTMRSPTTDETEAPIHYGQLVDRTNPPNPQNVSLGETLEELFCEHPNVLAHVTGHEHNNYVEHYQCAGDQPPTPGAGDFWEVSTAAHVDWPQQARMIELVRDGPQMDLVLTILDHDGPANPGSGPLGEGVASDVVRLASIAREIAYNHYQLGKFSTGRGKRDDRNLIVPLGRPFPCPSAPAECGPG